MTDRESFVLGVEPIPDWFMDGVSANDIILHGEWRDLRSATMKCGLTMTKGDLIHRLPDGSIMFTRNPDDRP